MMFVCSLMVVLMVVDRFIVSRVIGVVFVMLRCRMNSRSGIVRIVLFVFVNVRMRLIIVLRVVLFIMMFFIDFL